MCEKERSNVHLHRCYSYHVVYCFFQMLVYTIENVMFHYLIFNTLLSLNGSLKNLFLTSFNESHSPAAL